jgi:hypothetical protein
MTDRHITIYVTPTREARSSPAGSSASRSMPFQSPT